MSLDPNEVFKDQVASLLGIPSVPDKQEEKQLYMAAYTAYQQEAYRKAIPLFTRLVLLSPFQFEYWKGLAAAKQMAQDYAGALQSWAVATFLNPDDPSYQEAARICAENREAE